MTAALWLVAITCSQLPGYYVSTGDFDQSTMPTSCRVWNWLMGKATWIRPITAMLLECLTSVRQQIICNQYNDINERAWNHSDFSPIAISNLKAYYELDVLNILFQIFRYISGAYYCQWNIAYVLMIISNALKAKLPTRLYLMLPKMQFARFPERILDVNWHHTIIWHIEHTGWYLLTDLSW